MAGQQRSDFPGHLPHFAGQGRGLHFQRGVVVAVNNFAEADFASQRSRKRKSIEGQYQLVVVPQLVGEDEAN
jgi:hypothetical protein